jgi:hypothetical protein
MIRHRPFNLKEGVMVFCFVPKFFFGQHKELEYFFLSRKNSESDYFFFLHQNQNIFFSNIWNQNIFLEKNHNPPPSSYMVVPLWLFILRNHSQCTTSLMKNCSMTMIKKILKKRFITFFFFSK